MIDILRPGGGTENQIDLLLRRLDRGRIEPFLCCLQPPAAGAVPPLPVEVLGLRRFLGPEGARALRRARRWIRGHELEVVLTFFRDAQRLGILAGRWAGVPVVASRRNLGYAENAAARLELRVLARSVKRFVANSEAAREDVIARTGISPRRVTVIYNAVDVERFRPPPDGAARAAARRRAGLPPDGYLIGCVATLRPVKGHHDLLKAFARVRAAIPGARLALVGEGPEEGPLRDGASALGVGGAVHFLGRRDDVAGLLAGFDAGALASGSESFSNALVEYLAAGLPAAATRVGGNEEVLGYGMLGRLTPPGDPGALAAALIELGRSPELRAELGQAARRHAVLNFALPVVVEQWHRLLESAAGR